MSGHRQAAVALHALAESDRALILAELPAADQATLRAYLEELRQLGFEGGAAAAEVLNAAASRGAAAPDRLIDASAQQMYALLEHEPAGLIAQLLALQDWPWSADLLACFAAPQRQQIVACAPPPGAAAPARDRFLREQVAQRLALPPRAEAAAAAPLSMLARLQQRMGVWNR